MVALRTTSGFVLNYIPENRRQRVLGVEARDRSRKAWKEVDLYPGPANAHPPQLIADRLHHGLRPRNIEGAFLVVGDRRTHQSCVDIAGILAPQRLFRDGVDSPDAELAPGGVENVAIGDVRLPLGSVEHNDRPRL